MATTSGHRLDLPSHRAEERRLQMVVEVLRARSHERVRMGSRVTGELTRSERAVAYRLRAFRREHTDAG